MENESDSNKDLSEYTSDQKNVTKNAKRRSVAESEIFMIETTSEERSSMKETKSFREEAMKENNERLKGTSSSESKRIDDTKKYDKSVGERKEEEFPSDKLKGEIKNPGKIDDTMTIDRHRCQPTFHDMIGKREQRREELDKMKGDLRQRLDMFECSIPAVMVWNIWRMSQGAPACKIKRILEKQFKDTKELSCRSTPSCHYDGRIREVEAERKQALRRMEEARALWSEKLAALEERRRKLDEAKRIQEEQKDAIEKLNEESRALREKREKKVMEMGDLCRCSDTRCKHLDKVSSVMSVKSNDIQCLEKLQQLAEEEMVTKREIAELERREETYMRTLQQADELWSKMEGDKVSTTNGLREQLDMKIAANQQLANRVCELEDALEKCQARLMTCRAELEKFLSIEKIETTIGRDDDVAEVVDKKIAVKAKVVHRPIGREDDIATVRDDEVSVKVEIADEEALAKIEVADEEVLARAEVEDEETLMKVILIDIDTETIPVVDDKLISVKPDLVDLAVDRPVDLVRIEDAESVVQPEDISYEQQRFKEVREYLSELGSLEELYEDDGEPCAPDFVCNDVVSSPTGMTDEELTTLGIKPTLVKKEDEAVSDEEREKEFQKELTTKMNDVDEKKKDEILEIEREAVEKIEKQVVEIVDIPVKETVTPTIKKEVTDDRPITMPIDQMAQVKKVEADEDIVIRDTSYNAIDAIQTTAATHPDYEVKEETDILAEQVSPYEIKSEEIKEENATITESKEKIKETEPTTKIESTPLPKSEEISIELNSSIEAIAKSELLSTPTKEEVPIGIEPPTAVSVTDSFQSPTIHEKEESKDDTIPVAVPDSDIEKIKAEETQMEEIVYDTKEIDKEDEKEEIDKEDEKEEIDKEDEKEEIDKEDEKEEIEKIIEKDEAREVLPPTEILKPYDTITEIKEVTEIKETKQDDEAIPADVTEETTPDAIEEEKIETEKFPITDEKVPIAVKEEIRIEEIRIEEAAPIIDVKDESLPEIMEEKIDTEEPARMEDEIKPAELLTDIAEPEKMKVIELPIEETEKKEFETVAMPPITDIAREEIEAAKLPPMADIVKEEKIEQEKLSLADVITEEKKEIIQPPISPPIKKEMEEEIKTAEESMLEIEIKKEEDQQLTKEEEIPAKVSPVEKPAEIKDEKEVPMEEKKPEVVQIELKIPISEIRMTEIEMSAISLPHLVVQPYLIIAKLKEKELQVIPAKQPCVGCYVQPPMETAGPLDNLPQTDILQTEIVQTEVMQTEVVQTEVMQAEVVQTDITQTRIVQSEVVQTKIVQTEAETEVVEITSQTVSTAESPRSTSPIRIISEYLKPIELKTSKSKIAGDSPEITGRKMLWRKRLKDQSTVTTASTGSQTDKTSHVSHDRVVRDERERARVPTDELLRSIKIAAGLVRPDAEREIRTINYGSKFEEMGRVVCNCCLCSGIPTPPLTEPKLDIQPQIDAKTATPPGRAALKRMFTRPRIDHTIPHDRLCSDCKVKIQSKLPREKYPLEKIIKKISRDQDSCCYTSSSGKTCRAVPRKRPIEKKDQACSAKISKRKNNFMERIQKDNTRSTENLKESTEPLSPSCICFKLEKKEPIKKGNCYCAD